MSHRRPLHHVLDALAESLQRTAQPVPPDAGPWVVVATVPHSAGDVATPLLGSAARFGMRRFATAEEAQANSVSMPAAKAYGGWALNIHTGATVRIAPFNHHTHP